MGSTWRSAVQRFLIRDRLTDIVLDSWASGVAYGSDKSLWWDQDKEKQYCLRIVDAYSAQMNKVSTGWTKGAKQDFVFPACSGSNTYGMATQSDAMKSVQRNAMSDGFCIDQLIAVNIPVI